MRGSLDHSDLVDVPLGVSNEAQGVLVQIHLVPNACLFGAVDEVHSKIRRCFFHVPDYLIPEPAKVGNQFIPRFKTTQRQSQPGRFPFGSIRCIG